MVKQIHVPVLLDEVIQYLRIKKGGIYVDCTLGGGGHSREILKKIGPKGKLVAIDQDESALKIARQELKNYKNVIFIHDNFRHLANILNSHKIPKCSGILFDLGVSSFQLDIKERGFSFNAVARLDMRMDTKVDMTAGYLVNNLPSEQLEKIIKEYGEERWARRIAKLIVEQRKISPINTTSDLVAVIARAMPAAARPKNIHLATRTFQALRIAVNDELEALKEGLKAAIGVLEKGGRLCVISFHSLEDRIIKDVFRELARGCTCPVDFPVCVCNKKSTLKIIAKKPILPQEEEIAANPRSRSAKLRVAEKL
jgi:16S rRNA (cytosine1402-N4)-methyltransferase